MIELVQVKRTYPFLLEDMKDHYSAPKGFVGRNICYAVAFGGEYIGGIVGGSSPLHLPGDRKDTPLNSIVNNLFFHVVPGELGYPVRNFTQKVLRLWRERVKIDWKERYDDEVLLFESLVELPRSGECYRRDGWTLDGQTKGFTCKRGPGKGTDSWSGKRVWDTTNLRPKLVFRRDA